MPKYCSVPNCRSDAGSSGRRKSFYKFPLQDPARLQQWLKNMRRENWTPSRHQYICHEHFAPSCFKVRWGIRYLDSDAVPTVFQVTEKRKAINHSEKKPKRLRDENTQSPKASDDGTKASHLGEMHTIRLVELAADPLEQAETSLMESSESPRQTEVDSLVSLSGVTPDVNLPLTLYQTVDDLINSGESAEVVMMTESSAQGGQVELVNGITAAILSPDGMLVLNELMLEAPPGVQHLTPTSEDFLQVHQGEEVVAYFETVPNVLPSGTLAFPPDTVLSSALSPEPISSTLPIVSKHVAPSSLVLAVERLDREEVEEGEGMSDADEAEQENHQLEEHCYHKNSLSKEQLEAVVAELQKKVKVLQQRHRRHLEKLLGLENTVSQLRQSNMLNEERLQLLERAYLQTSAAVSDGGETVAIIYEEDDAAYFYTPVNDAGMALNVDSK
ncbi:PREDICTED: THAP domain-containing protein 5-like [Cyprinodon variegatus]|uniref:THAP domain-containing protein 5-like n=1 Tax=Cyprinodon variegatus TaxID=28743 RepID=UPI00074268B2|nr:PREDICTED: THAP domain-containing protein 5-like [Cyprinodon variegatus]